MTTTPETSSPTHAWGIGLATLAADGSTLDVWYPAPNPGPAQEAPAAHPPDAALEPASRADDAYLRLHLLSHRLVQPNTQNLEGLFGKLTNVVWTSQGPCAVPGFEETRLRLIAAGRTPTVFSVDKFPRMVDYVMPSGVRIG